MRRMIQETVNPATAMMAGPCRRHTFNTEQRTRVTLQEGTSHVALEVDAQGVDPSRLYVWVKRNSILILGHHQKNRSGSHRQSFVRTIKLNQAVDGRRAIVEKLNNTLHILVPKMA